MPVFRLDERLLFPPVRDTEDGLLAVGGDLSPERLVLAYSQGIFPWYSEPQPILWHSPDPRFVLLAQDVKVGRSLRKTIRRGAYRITLDTAFSQVIEACARMERPGQRGTWITPEMRRAYLELHRRGLAHSAEAWQGAKLAGGLYGVSLGAAYFGESMFARSPDASKVALVALVEQLLRWGIKLIDCQVPTDHLARFGATGWPRKDYLAALRKALRHPTRPGPWRFDPPNESAAGSASPPARRVGFGTGS